MKIPQLKKKTRDKNIATIISWEDNYSWIHQNNILEVLKDSKKLNPDVRKYLRGRKLCIQIFIYQRH